MARETGEAAALERSASLLGGRRVETGEASAEEEALSLPHLFRYRLGRGQGRAILRTGSDQEIVRLFGIVGGGDLDDPVRLCIDVRVLRSGDAGLRTRIVGARLLPTM